MGLEKTIIEIGKKFKKENKGFLALIKKYDRIAVFRHIKPDFDALGTQYGLANWIKDNFPNKEVVTPGDNHVVFSGRLFPESDKLNEEWFSKPFLGIIVDVGNKSRIADPRFEKAKELVKIDHHPKTEDVADIDITDTETAAASELVVALLLNLGSKYKLSAKAARDFYIALVGDSGRFQYSSTTALTFAVASHLVNTGIKVNEICQDMYLKQIDDLKVTAYVLNNFEISPKGVAYYVLTAKICEELKITSERGKENVNLFSNIEGIPIWCSITEDPTPNDYCWRISIRSRAIPINGVATEFGGGGHAQASGARIDSLDDLPKFISALDALVE